MTKRSTLMSHRKSNRLAVAGATGVCEIQTCGDRPGNAPPASQAATPTPPRGQPKAPQAHGATTPAQASTKTST